MPHIHVRGKDVPPVSATGAQAEIVFLAVTRGKGGGVEKPGLFEAIVAQIKTEADPGRQFDRNARANAGS